MKKIALFGFACLSCLLLAGCGSEKVLTCSMTQEQSGLNMEQIVDITFSDDKVTNVKMTVDSDATDDTIKDNWDTFASMLDQQFPDSDKEGIKVTKENNKDKHNYKIVIDVDVTKANDDDLAEYSLSGLADAEGTYDSVKEQAEKSGFTCE